jgi:hypothetical protein
MFIFHLAVIFASAFLTVKAIDVIAQYHAISTLEKNLTSNQVDLIEWDGETSRTERYNYLGKMLFTHNAIDTVIDICNQLNSPNAINAINTTKPLYYALVAKYPKYTESDLEGFFVMSLSMLFARGVSIIKTRHHLSATDTIEVSVNREGENNGENNGENRENPDSKFCSELFNLMVRTSNLVIEYNPGI